jgi:hypothetical protein
MSFGLHPWRDTSRMPRGLRRKLAGMLGGGASRDRTDDLLDANQTLSQLSYGPMNFGGTCGQGVVGPVGLEPTT